MEQKPTLNDQLRQAEIERAYLHYYNSVLLEQGLITPEEYRKMKVKIAARKSGPSGRS